MIYNWDASICIFREMEHTHASTHARTHAHAQGFCLVLHSFMTVGEATGFFLRCSGHLSYCVTHLSSNRRIYSFIPQVPGSLWSPSMSKLLFCFMFTNVSLKWQRPSFASFTCTTLVKLCVLNTQLSGTQPFVMSHRAPIPTSCQVLMRPPHGCLVFQPLDSCVWKSNIQHQFQQEVRTQHLSIFCWRLWTQG